MGRKLLKTVQTITTFRNPLADPLGTRRGPQFENRCSRAFQFAIRNRFVMRINSFCKKKIGLIGLSIH